MFKKQNLEQITRYADMFSAMGTESRLRIMQLLLSAYPDGLVVGEIGNELEIPSSTLSHYLEKLKNEDLVKVRREGTFLWSRVGPTGKAYGLDMTDEMLALAEENKRKSGLTNVEFLKGEIENIPLPDNSVDVIISNCVINLSGDKDRVLKEAFRVLNPGGRFAVSDVVVRGDVPAEIKKNIELWVGCVAGALSDYEYVAKLAKAGFDNIDIEPTRVYSIEDARTFLSARGLDVDALAREVEDKFISAFVRASKPATACCAPGCCS